MSEENIPAATKMKPPKRKSKATKFKKAPQAPKRFKSAFMLFSTMKHPEIRASLASKEDVNANVPRVAKLVAEAWRNLAPEERAVWDKRSSDDKKRYEVEKAMYTGPWKIPASKRARKDPNAPKRPMSAFLAYSQKMRSVVKQDNQHLSNTEISKLLAEMWRGANEEIRSEYIEREAEQRSRYKVEMDEWRTKQENELNTVRKEREQLALDVIANGGGDEEIRKHRLQMAAQNGQQQQQHVGPYPPATHSRGPPPPYMETRDEASRYYQSGAYYNGNPPPAPGYYHYPGYQDMPPNGANPYPGAAPWPPEGNASNSAYGENMRRTDQAGPPSAHYPHHYEGSYYHSSGTSSPGNVPSHAGAPPAYERSEVPPYYGGGHGYQAGYPQGHSYYG